jgi:hypothetical protein|uniref:Proline rich protein HaeIII subfamily 2 n=1 Tax=Homo sapiens TaxID=9606 RepID=A0ABJ7H387_HUMAN
MRSVRDHLWEDSNLNPLLVMGTRMMALSRDHPNKEASSNKVHHLLRESHKDHPNREAIPLLLKEGHKDHPNREAIPVLLEEGHKDHPNREAISKVLPHLLLESPRDHLPKGAAHKDLHRGSLLSNLGFNDRYDSSLLSIKGSNCYSSPTSLCQ